MIVTAEGRLGDVYHNSRRADGGMTEAQRFYCVTFTA